MAIQHYFFGKECLIDRALTNYSDLNKNLAAQNLISPHPVAFLNQIHSSDIFVIDDKSKIPSSTNRPKADAIVTNLKNLTIGLFTADCAPILFFDETNSVIAAAHSGWQGAFKNITKNTIDAMLKMGAKIGNIQTIIGPTIQQKSYEISQEFYDRFMSEGGNNEKFFINSKRAKHYLFDLPSYIKDQLVGAGIKNIIDEKIDTYSNPEKFFSYRRSTHLGEVDCGRNVSVIQIS